MNDKLQYATMLEIPVSTCNVTYKRTKSRRSTKKKAESPEAVKEQLLEKVNAQAENSPIGDAERALVNVEEQSAADTPTETAAETAADLTLAETAEKDAKEETSDAGQYVSANVTVKKRKPFFRFSAVTAELVAAAVLIAIIFLTNAVYSDSAINVFMRRVFAPTAVTEKSYSDFTPVMNFSGDMTVKDGVVSYTGEGTVYAAVDGTVTDVLKETDGTYTVTVAHSENFSSTIFGLKYAYLGKGDKVFGNIPVGYANDSGFSMCFSSENAVITDYTVENNAVIWAA